MAIPTTDLETTFKHFCKEFNDARTNGSYGNIPQFLNSFVSMQYVDDPGILAGSRKLILRYLTASQANTGNWPLFTPDPIHINQCERYSVGYVTGPATYQDIYSDISTIINVTYAFRLIQDANNIWLIHFASATPVSPPA